MEDQMGNWNDDRHDELSGRVDEGFADVNRRFEKVATKEEMGEVKAGLRHLDERFDRLQQALMVGGIAFGTALLATFGGLIATHA